MTSAARARRAWWARSFVVLLCAALAVVVMPTASAHNWLTHSNPAAGSSISSAPSEVQLTFDDRVLTKPAEPRVAVTGPGGKHYETGCATALGRDVTTVWAPGQPGVYTVEWRIISADGHPVSDRITFTYTGKPGTNAGSPAAPSCASGSAATDTSGQSGEAASHDSNASDGGVSTPVVVALVAGAVALGAIVLMVARARRHPRDVNGIDDSDEHDD